MFIVYEVLRGSYWDILFLFFPFIWVGGRHEYDPIKMFLMTKLACLHDKREMNSIAMSGTQNNIYSNVDKITLV